jgi:hypothetical protein
MVHSFVEALGLIGSLVSCRWFARSDAFESGLAADGGGQTKDAELLRSIAVRVGAAMLTPSGAYVYAEFVGSVVLVGDGNNVGIVCCC